MPSLTQLHKEEEALGAWPRRLLHVPSLTSYEWQPGSCYGPASSPAYNAITYTWGRWRLGDNQAQSVQAINVSGVPWKIPTVQPNLFTDSQSLHVVQQATKYYSQIGNKSVSLKSPLPPVVVCP